MCTVEASGFIYICLVDNIVSCVYPRVHRPESVTRSQIFHMIPEFVRLSKGVCPARSVVLHISRTVSGSVYLIAFVFYYLEGFEL